MMAPNETQGGTAKKRPGDREGCRVEEMSGASSARLSREVAGLMPSKHASANGASDQEQSLPPGESETRLVQHAEKGDGGADHARDTDVSGTRQDV